MNDNNRSKIESFLYNEYGRSFDFSIKERKNFNLFDFDEKKSPSLNVENSKKYQDALNAELIEWDNLLYNAKADIEKEKNNKKVIKKEIFLPSQVEYLERNQIPKYVAGTNEFNIKVQEFLEEFSQVSEMDNRLRRLIAQKLRIDSLYLTKNYINEEKKF